MRFTLFTIAGAFAGLACAQTFTQCDPTKKDCPNDPAMAATFDTDFRKGAESVRGWKQTAGSLTYSQEGAQFTINKRGDAPTIQSEAYLFFGYVEVKMKASPGQGIISSIVLQSEDLDEVDWEFLGTHPNSVQTNFFGKGNTTTYDRMIEVGVSNAQPEMHTYALDWTAERLVYLIDGKPVRTLNYADPKANGGRNYPQTPCTVRLGIWAGGDPSNEKGVIEWAEGPTDYSKAPFTMTVESVKVKNYSPGKEYKWTDKSGSWQSIEVVGAGDVNGAPENSVTLAPTASATGSLQSGIDATGKAPQPSATATQSSIPEQSDSPQESSLPSESGATPCNCDDIATVTVTGVPPPAQTPTTLITSSGYGADLPSTPSAQPPVDNPVTSFPPYQTGGIETDTNPPPSVPFPTGGFPALPSGNASAPTPSAPLEFPGAASNNKASVLAILVAAAVMFVY
ncbi:concanavalin A-like lectin/glucanase [Westerdykella ornata]|uniref:chitinase n=1 Tax=Westerdykella ornata TaxID=318751 RepID=A0A6A6JJ78_WESOR|nr:concanavalin A-like lectin/glucanase [Westerdykella ornata]KAF2276512.1 concanavalin A-like lectin/glucanase [Westerdykella ornata]